MSERRPQTVAWAPALWGADGVPLDDPAETFHEASRLHPRTSYGTSGAAHLARDAALRASTVRATKRHSARAVPLPPAAPVAAGWSGLVAARRSERSFADRPVSLDQVGGILRDAYGVTHALDGLPLRAVPSGGGLYPLELYVVARDVEGVASGVYHFDPLREAIEPVPTASPEGLAHASPYGHTLAAAAFVLVVTAIFWRTRFKYGLRGYRFALLEAGHLGQNVLLSTVARGLGATAIGGFYDRRLDAVVAADGLDEASVYAFAIGWPA